MTKSTTQSAVGESSGESVVHGTAKVTWAKFIDICKEKSIGVYRGRVTKLKEELVNNVDGVHLSTRKVQLDSTQLPPTFHPISKPRQIASTW